MKITFNGKIDAKVIDRMLTDQEIKKQNIISFCIKNKINEMHYKDSELEFEYKKEEKQFTNPKPKVETRGGVKDAKG